MVTMAVAVLIDSAPAEAGCSSTGELDQIVVGCYMSGDEVRDKFNSPGGAVWSIVQRCRDILSSGDCFNPSVCTNDSGITGTLYDVFSTPPGGLRRHEGVACLTADEAGSIDVITPGMVLEAMRGLAWPKSELVVQPPGGETLVNFETNFYTTNTDPTTQTVTLLGQRVEIEATPTAYVWHWGGSGADGASQETTSPGSAYPSLDVTHRYQDAEVTAHPRVDTVYSGRYRVNGGGWTAVPDTLTVAGDPISLDILEAHPVLVG